MKAILIATDFSPAANNAASYALELARYFGAKLILLNAYQPPHVNYEVQIAPDILSELEQASRDSLNQLKEELEFTNLSNPDIECIAALGDAYDVIDKVSKENNIDLVVMGIIGHSGILKEYLIGSTAVSTARHLALPVLIIPEEVKYKRIHKLSFACDMEHTEESDVIYSVKYFARLFDAELEIVNIEQPGMEMTEEKGNTMEFVEEKLTTVEHKTFTALDKDPAHGLEDYYKRYPTADLIILNTKKHNVFQKIFTGSVIRKMAFHTKVPLLVIH